MTDQIATLRNWLDESRSTVAFTGAGISTESGVPDFRSPGGVWARSKPVYFDDFLADPAARREYWRQKAESHVDFTAARPNIAHETLARWERENRLRGVITQNIDGLHQLAGSANVLELHGTAREIACLDCQARRDADPLVNEFNRTGEPPDCPECGGRMKHATISFGQSLDPEVIERAERWSRVAELYLAIGSSLVVMPAAGFPLVAKNSGARLAIINREETPLDEQADVVIRAPIGEVFKHLTSAERRGARVEGQMTNDK